jgi:hypothetical protein
MKTLPFLLTFVLTCAWGYTSWYWYTCNIKGFCNGASSNTLSYTSQENIDEQDIWDTSTSWRSGSLTRLSAEDVLLEDTLWSDTWEIIQQDTLLTSTGNTSTGTENLIKETQLNTTDTNLLEWETLCNAEFIWPVAVGGKNDPKQVQLLENFLLSQWESIQVDGVYDSVDVEAVKKFQLEYKEDILDPWGIAAPTWYVFTTTIKKMKEIACE